MDARKLRAIQALQMPNREKCRRADYIVDTGGSLGATKKQLAEIVKGIGGRRSRFRS
jgi:dephospho-CoA kinase